MLDASALLALLYGEPGADAVLAALHGGAVMSAVNWAETLSKVAETGGDPVDAATRLADEGALGDRLAVLPLVGEEAPLIARLRPSTRDLGLSLADRACLALAIRLDRPVLTADRAWAGLRIGVEVRMIRD